MPDRDVIDREILRQIAARGAGKTICPSEVARALSDDWRGLMPAVRAAAAALAAEGQVEVTQNGQAADALTARGPIRLGIAQETD